DDDRPNAEERPRCGAGLQRRRTRQRRDKDAAGLGLPPGVDDGAARVADDIVVPQPGFRIDWLADAAEQAQRAALGLLDRALALAHERADRRRRGVEDGHLVLVADLPEARGVG